MLEYSIIVCVDSNYGIGKSNSIPWYFPEDLRHFKHITLKNVVIMGRKTWDSLPEKFKPLKNRINIIITRNPRKLKHLIDKKYPFTSSQVFCSSNFGSALKEAKRYPKRKKFVIGGASIYKLAIGRPYCTELFITELNHNYKCDVFFPEFKNNWNEYNSILQNETFSIKRYKKHIDETKQTTLLPYGKTIENTKANNNLDKKKEILSVFVPSISISDCDKIRPNNKNKTMGKNSGSLGLMKFI